ncbi:MAG: hypothetical protein WBF53_02265, partial [Litorimonas sp.]
GVPRATASKWPGVAALCALALSTAALAATLLVPGDKAAAPLYPETVTVRAAMNPNSPFHREALTFEMPIADKHAQTLTLSLKDGTDYRLWLETALAQNGSLLNITASGCVPAIDACERTDLNTVAVRTRPETVSSAEAEVRLGGENSLEFDFATHTTRPPQPRTEP